MINLNKPDLQQQQLKLKIKKTTNKPTIGSHNTNDQQRDKHLFNATGDVYRNEYLSNEGRKYKIKSQANATMDMADIIQSAQKIKSPIALEEYEEYHAVGREKDSESHYHQQDDEYQDIDQEIKVPNFLSRASLEPRDKNQFYMTQIINNAPPILNQKASYTQPKHAKSQVKAQSTKKGQGSLAKSMNSLAKSSQKGKQMSPHQAIDTGNILDKYMNLYDVASHTKTKSKDYQQHKKRSLNTSALLVNHHRGDLLNSTAPLNLTQIRMYDKEALNVMGFSDAVNSTQNFHRMNSKESWKDPHQQNISSYYNGTGTLNYMNSGSNTRQSVSPIKDQRKKQMMMKSLLMKQDAVNAEQSKKYFLNLTLQQLMHQQQTQNKEQDMKKAYKAQKRLNKTLDNFRDNYANIYYSSNANDPSQNLRSFVNNFTGTQNYTQQSIPKKNQVRPTSSSQQRAKFSSTMKIKDLNQTQIIDVKSTQSGKKSKNSLKSTQNINFHEDVASISSKTPVDPQRKYSAMSTYSQNTGSLPTTSHLNQVNNRKVVSSKKALQVSGQGNTAINLKSQTRAKVDNESIQAMLKLYQADLISQVKGDGIKNKTMKTGNAYTQPLSKHKTNSTLGQYLKVAKSKPSGSNTKKERTSMNNSFLSIAAKNPNMTYTNTELKNYDGLVNLRKNVVNKADNRMTDIALSFKNTCSDLEGKLNPYSNKPQVASKSQVKEIQNKTQPIPKQLLEMAQAEAANYSTGTSVMGINHRASNVDSQGKSRSKSRGKSQIKVQQQKQEVVETKAMRQEGEKPQPKDDPAKIYNNKNTVILEEISISQDQVEEDQPTNEQKLDRYVLGKQIGQGAYAVVRVAQAKKDGKKYAIKIYDKSKLTDINRQRSVRREIKLLQKMKHPNIVKIFEAFETENHVYLVMEYVGGGSLHSYLKEKPHRRLEEEDAKFIFKQILTALHYCHRKSIAHRDIKLENILLDENKQVKLIDFGFSTCIPNDKKIKMFCGTPSYMAPEIVAKEEYAGPPADIWASGVLLYALMNGCFPFRGSTDKELYRRIQRGTFIMHNQHASPLLIEFLEKMININADERISAEELLQHQWFKVIHSDTNQEQSISDQKKLFKAKILSKIPIDKTNNNICLISQNDRNTLKLATHNINLGQGHTQFKSNPLATQAAALNDSSDYGLSSSNAMRKLNHEAYQAYYNTSGGCNYGLGNTMPNPYYNNFFYANTNFVNQAQQAHPTAMNFPNKGSPQKNGHNSNGLNIQTQLQPVFPINFNQQPPNQVGTPQVFGSPTALNQYGATVNNNWVIKHVDALINVYNSPPQVVEPQRQTNPTSPHSQIYQPQIMTQNQLADDYAIEVPNAYNKKQDQASDYDEEILDSLAQMGYQRSHVVSQLQYESSQITQLYSRMKEDKMSKTQQRPLSQQPHSRRPGNNYHNNAIFPPTFIPSIPDSLKALGDQDNSGEGQKLFS